LIQVRAVFHKLKKRTISRIKEGGTCHSKRVRKARMYEDVWIRRLNYPKTTLQNSASAERTEDKGVFKQCENYGFRRKGFQSL